MSELSELIAKLEATTGSDREIDWLKEAGSECER
jgi:hypothetical protein